MDLETAQPTAPEISDAKTLEKSSSTTLASRYGRTRKPNVSPDFVALGKNVRNSLSPSTCASVTNGEAPDPSKQQPVSQKRANTSSNRLPDSETPGMVGNGEISIKTPESSSKAGNHRDSMKAQDTKIKATPSVTTPASASPTPTTPSSSIMPGCEFVGNADKEWAIGDIAWGGMGKFPYWPCIIMNDPLSKTHVCEKSKGRSTSKCYFLQFCGDNGRHSWLPAKNLLEFINKQQFFDLQSKVLQDPRKKATFAVKFTLRSHSKDSWENAVTEAEHLMSLGSADRVMHFQLLYPIEVQRTKKDLIKLLMEEEVPSSNQKSQPKISAASPEPSVSVQDSLSAPKKQEDKVKRADQKKEIPLNSKSIQKKQELGSNEESSEAEMNEEVESVPMVKRQKSPVKKPKKKRKQEFGPDFDLYYSKTFDRLADEHPELKDEDIEKYLRKVWLAMNDTQKLKYQPRFVKEVS
nr:PREDICTED: histone-lysine N-methyltransferase NSD2-like isoform X1 [Bemisia tabaci]XP_018906782.1 PREDICTED: histone-lysine N-methyltransferase NSD2-like isoform X1 [Bemisia tabaci]XP_018906783.1 PREDICTED: histone-lysine N-methyltransferase NSD2-like isoform X1 [Bemisia tabaci]XP_018906784.1 PREDICTED: histone-lysine N-methyltransferase NSD2-like isoform X1 [Bemisia tabaci]